VNSLTTLVFKVQQNSTYPEALYPDRLDPSDKCVWNSAKLICIEIAGYRIKYGTLLLVLEIQIGRGRKF
jgi:hypothetical protein